LTVIDRLIKLDVSVADAVVGRKAVNMESNRDVKLDELLGRAIRDAEFREKMTSSPSSVAGEYGLSEEEAHLFAAALAIGSNFGRSPVAFCTGRICNEGSAAQIKMPEVFWAEIKEEG
jgi:hypothetical protein